MNAAKGGGRAGWPFSGGGVCIGRFTSLNGSSGFGGERLAGSWAITIAPFSFPRYFSKSSSVLMSTYTTEPRTTPAVPGAQPADAIVSGCSVGDTMRACAVPRVQECAMVHGSRCTFVRPYSRNFTAVQSLACFNCGEPVSRGPMASPRYSLFCITSLWSRTSLRICASAAANALASSAAGFANPARTPANTSTTAQNNTATRREFIHTHSKNLTRFHGKNSFAFAQPSPLAIGGG